MHLPELFRSPAFVAGPLFFASLNAMAAVSFEKEVLPVLQTKCMDCHKAPTVDSNGKKKEPKAGLRLDAAWAILKGSENGPVLKPGESDKSGLYQVVTLPKDDDGFMPPKGDPLTDQEIKLLKSWIDEGADFGGWEGSQEGRPEGSAGGPKVAKVREHEVFYKKLAEGLKPAPEKALDEAKAAGAQVALLKADGALLRADFLTGVSSCTDEKVARLLPLKDHLAQLDLGRTAITDAALESIGQMPRLAELDLRQTQVTDAGLAALSNLKNLQSLNLYGTGISDAGIKHLVALKSLKEIYLWQSKVTDAGLKELAAALPKTKIVGK